MRRLLPIIILLLMPTITALAQKEFNNWHFGRHAAITFNTPNLEPIVLNGSAINQYEGCATISDRNGNLLFYTDGISVWNKNHTKMNGGLSGSASSTQSALIIRKPGSRNIYYLFTADDYGISHNPPRGICYSTIDMNANSGLGDVISTERILKAPSTEKLTATKHANDKDVWIITHDYGNGLFRVFKVTDKGVDTNAVTSIAGSMHLSTNPCDGIEIGHMKISAKGDMIALAVTFCVPMVEVFKFDNKTGEVKDSLSFPFPLDCNPYGVEFSPDGRKLYISVEKQGNNPFDLIQFDLSLQDSAEIYNNRKILDSSSNVEALQTGPNGKIYVARYLEHYLGVINNPNGSGDLCSYQQRGINLDTGTCLKGLPNNIITTFSIKIDGKNVCEGDTIILKDAVYGEDSSVVHIWTLPNGETSNKNEIIIPNASAKNEGLYILKAYQDNYVSTDSIYIHVGPSLKISIKPRDSVIICEGKDTTLFAQANQDYVKFTWSTVSHDDRIKVSKSGKYILKGETPYGCIDYDTVTVIGNPVPIARIDGTTIFCTGDSAVLKSSVMQSGWKYLWSTKDTSQSIVVKKEGIYWLTITNKWGCLSSDTVKVKVEPDINASITATGNKTSFCGGENIILNANPSNPAYKYKWSTGDSSMSIVVNKPGTYSVKISLNDKCTGSASISVSLYPNPEVKIIGETCIDKELTLSTDKLFSAYLWSNGDITRETTIKKPGKYEVIVTDEHGCMDTATFEVFEKPSIYIKANGRHCESCKTELTGPEYKQGYIYHWSTGETSQTIIADMAGVYTLYLDNGHCISNTAQYIIYKNPKVEIEGNSIICKGKETWLRAASEFATYHWSNGDTTKEIRTKLPGIYSLTVSDTNGCTADAYFEVKVMDISISKMSDILYDTLCTGEFAEKEFKIANNGKDTAYIASLQLLDDNYIFIMDSAQSVILPYQDIICKIKFVPKKPGNYHSKLAYLIDKPCFASDTMELSGTAIAKTFVELPDTAGRIDQLITIPIRAKLICGDTISPDEQYSAEIRYDASAFMPELTDASGVHDNGITAGERVLSISGSDADINQTEREFKSFTGRIMLPNHDKIPLKLTSFKWDNPYIYNTSKDGFLTIYGICQQNLAQLVSRKALTLSISPTLVKETAWITISGEEQGDADINIYTMTGVKIESIEVPRDIRNTPYKLELSDYPAGLYQVVAKVNNTVMTGRLVVVK